MTRRLTITIVGMVLATLLFVGLGTLAVAGARARSRTASELKTQAREMVSALVDPTLNLDGSATTGTSAGDGAPSDAAYEQIVRRRVALVRRIGGLLKLEDISVVVASGGRLQGSLPAYVDSRVLDVAKLRSGKLVVGRRGTRVWVAAGSGASPTNRSLIVVLTREANPGVGAALSWFVVAAMATLVMGLLAAWLLGRRLTKPVRQASLAAHDIAAGDLSTRLPDPGPGGDELAELARSINTMAERLERSKGLEQEFLLSVSHDLRTPLTSIRGYAEAVTDGAGDPAKAAAIIMSEAQRLERLVADLLDLAKLQCSSFRLQGASLDLSAALVATAEGFAPAADTKGIILRVEASNPVTVWADRDRLGQVLSNLVENASKYARTTVVLSAWAEGGNGVLVVDDDGPGISPEDLPHVFERLYVSRRAPMRRENSSGLGLAIVRELIRAMGGSVAAGSSPSGGARFTAVLPLANAMPAPRPS